MVRSSRQKINMETADLNNTIDPNEHDRRIQITADSSRRYSSQAHKEHFLG